MNFKTTTRIIEGAESALAMVMNLAMQSAWFQFGPVEGEPDEKFVITVREEKRDVLFEDPTSAYALIQEGGASNELYIHSHVSEGDAEEDRVSCADDGSYRTSPIVKLSPAVAMLGERFYEAATALIDASCDLGFPVPADDRPQPKGEWSREDAASAQAQGWDIFECDGQQLLERDDDMGVFSDDSAAAAFVKKQALLGDALAIKAINFLSANESPDIHKFSLIEVLIVAD